MAPLGTKWSMTVQRYRVGRREYSRTNPDKSRHEREVLRVFLDIDTNQLSRDLVGLGPSQMPGCRASARLKWLLEYPSSIAKLERLLLR